MQSIASSSVKLPKQIHQPTKIVNESPKNDIQDKLDFLNFEAISNSLKSILNKDDSSSVGLLVENQQLKN